MSDKWETVGKAANSPKAGGGSKKKNGGPASKKAAKPLPRIEDILPPGSMQVCSTNARFSSQQSGWRISGGFRWRHG